MTDLRDEEPINRRLEHDRPGRSFIDVFDSRWGELILPSAEETAPRSGKGLRIIAVTSFYFGLEVLEALLQFERTHPDLVTTVAVATDDAINAEAKISLKKRIWKDYSQDERIEAEIATVEAALSAGVPVYTGEMKIDWFHGQLAHWQPDAIIVCGCGQIFDLEIIEQPRFGIYNFHPSDLAQGHGAGAQPYEDSIARNDPITRWTVHQMVQEIDAGPIVGSSPPIRIADPHGIITPDAKRYYDKMAEAVGPMVPRLLEQLSQLHSSGGPPGRRVDKIDFPSLLPEALKGRLNTPLA
jgi:methionyl-tRNA formyltransferase